MLERYRASKNYGEKLLIWNEFCHYYNKNKLVILVQVLMGAIFLNFTFNSIGMTLPLVKNDYPNDFVGATQHGSGFIDELKKGIKAIILSFLLFGLRRLWVKRGLEFP